MLKNNNKKSNQIMNLENCDTPTTLLKLDIKCVVQIKVFTVDFFIATSQRF